MESFIVLVILTAIVGGIIWYLIRAKKRGEKCIGCPYARECKRNCGGIVVFSPQIKQIFRKRDG